MSKEELFECGCPCCKKREVIPQTIPYIPEKPTCPKCGLELGKVMGYVCSNPDCPCFPKVMC